MTPTLAVEDIKRLIAIAEKYHEALDQATAWGLDLSAAIGDICAATAEFTAKYGQVPQTLPSKLPWWSAFEQIIELQKIKKGYGL